MSKVAESSLFKVVYSSVLHLWFSVFLGSVSVSSVHVLEMMWSRHPVLTFRCYDYGGYDFNNGPAKSFLSVELWSGKNILYFTAQQKYTRSAVGLCHLQYMYFQIQVTLFKQDNSLNPKVGFQGGLSEEWVAVKNVRDGVFKTFTTHLSGFQDQTAEQYRLVEIHVHSFSAASSRSSCCLCLSSEFRWWWHDFPWLPQWLRCYVTSRFPILLKVVRQKPQEMGLGKERSRIKTKKDTQNRLPL